MALKRKGLERPSSLSDLRSMCSNCGRLFRNLEEVRQVVMANLLG
jgi:hypothetical protein